MILSGLATGALYTIGILIGALWFVYAKISEYSMLAHEMCHMIVADSLDVDYQDLGYSNGIYALSIDEGTGPLEMLLVSLAPFMLLLPTIGFVALSVETWGKSLLLSLLSIASFVCALNVALHSLPSHADFRSPLRHTSLEKPVRSVLTLITIPGILFTLPMHYRLTKLDYLSRLFYVAAVIFICSKTVVYKL